MVATYVHNSFKRAEDGSHRRPDERDLLEDASLADQDVEQRLVDTDKLGMVSRDNPGEQEGEGAFIPRCKHRKQFRRPQRDHA